jgi:hypothetical protein
MIFTKIFTLSWMDLNILHQSHQISNSLQVNLSYHIYLFSFGNIIFCLCKILKHLGILQFIQEFYIKDNEKYEVK